MPKFTYDNKNYVLTFTRETAKEAEKHGVTLEKKKYEELPLNSITALVTFSFKANHPEMSEDDCMQIYKNISNKEDFIAALLTDFSKTYETIMAEPDPKNAIKWESA